MNVIVQSKTIVVTQAIRSFAIQQARKLQKHRPNISQVTVFLEIVKKKKNDVQAATAKFALEVPGKRIVVQERAKDLYTAISDASRGTARQLQKVKERHEAAHLIHGKKLRIAYLPVKQ
jgi:ribosomal subunit interface protein